MKILNNVLPKDVIHYHIQPHLMIPEREVRMRYDLLIVELRLLLAGLRYPNQNGRFHYRLFWDRQLKKYYVKF